MSAALPRHVQFLVMELVQGETLGERLQRGPLAIERALAIAHQIAEALEAAHEKGIIHRDLKPPNVKITPDEQVKVLDFGLAKAVGPTPAAADVTLSPTLSLMATQAGVILGTAAYMSPEQAKGSPADHRSDVFSFGSVLYEMLAGQSPFKGETAPEILASVLAREVDFTALPSMIFKGSPRSPSVSPDGQWIGFVDNNTLVKKVAVTGGPAVTLTAADGAAPRGVTWTSNNSIVFATNSAATGLQRVPAMGGMPEVLSQPDRTQGESDHLWPEALPGGRAVLFTITAQTGGLDAAQIAVLDLDTGTRKVLIRGGSHARYVSSGHLVYAAAGTLRAVAFDMDRLETRGVPVPVIAQIVVNAAGSVDAAIAADGTLAYVAGGGAGPQRTLAWVTRQGQELPIAAPPRAYIYPRLAPDGTAVTIVTNDDLEL